MDIPKGIEADQFDTMNAFVTGLVVAAFAFLWFDVLHDVLKSTLVGAAIIAALIVAATMKVLSLAQDWRTELRRRLTERERVYRETESLPRNEPMIFDERGRRRRKVDGDILDMFLPFLSACLLALWAFCLLLIQDCVQRK